MALKTKEIRAMGPEDRAKALTENRGELMHQRGQAAMGGAMKNPGLIRDLRTSIARILTVQREDELRAPAAKPAPAKPKAAKPAAAKPAKAPAKKPAAKKTAPAGKAKGGAR